MVDSHAPAADTTPARAAKPRSLGTKLLDEIGSVWFGVTMMVLILIYSWLGSAGTQPFYDWFPRQTFELTEMEWFAWWPFQAMIGLLCLALALVTIRKIKFNLPNLGVWTVHVGIVTLALGCAVYFGLKLEGDVPVYKRQAVISVPGGETVALPLQPGATATVAGPGLRYEVRVVDLQHDYELLTGDDKGKRTYAAQLQVTPVESGLAREPFIRQVLDGYPQYTEDVLPGQGRAVKILGKPIVDERISIETAYHDPSRIFLHGQRAIHVRQAGANAPWVEMPIDGLPRYSEHMDPTERAMVAPGEPPLRARQLAIDLEPEGEPGPAAGHEVRVTGFLPFAVLRQAWEPGGKRVNPYVRFALQAGEERVVEELLAFDPRKSRIDVGEGFSVAFSWVENEAELTALTTPVRARLLVTPRGSSRAQEIDLADAVKAPVPVRGTPYSVEVTRLFPRWSLTRGAGDASMALVRVTGGEKNFTRAVVTPQKEFSQDLDEGGHLTGTALDPSLSIELDRVPDVGLRFVAGPVGRYVIMTTLGGAIEKQPLEVGERASFLENTLHVDPIVVMDDAQRVDVPLVIPPRERNLKSGDAYSLVQVEVARGGERQRRWLEYSHYAHPSRLGFNPVRVQLGDGPPLELVYSRATHPLPAPVALETFRLETYPGGEKERDYISLVRFFEDGKWSDLHEVRSNQPTEHAGWWYFQATWDPPEPRQQYAGMFYTGLGVGNRHGVGIMLLGSILTVVGTIYAFYVKPLIIRRRRDQGQLAREQARTVTPDREAAAARGAAMAGLEGR